MQSCVSSQVFIAAALLGLSFGQLLPGQTTNSCSPKDMQGGWAKQPQGFFTAGPVAGPFGATGTEVFDGVGRFDGKASSSFNGQIIFPFGADGSYTVTPDCRITIFEETLRITFQGWLVNNNTEAVLYEPDPTSIAVVLLRRQNIATCDLTNLKGTWVLSASGFNIVVPDGRFAWNARLVFDGLGRVAGIASKSDNGVITGDGKYSGVYTLNASDCSFKMKLTDDTGLTLGFFGSLFDNSRQLLFISNDPGQVVTGFGKTP